MEAGVKLLDRLTPAQREQLARLLPRLLPFADAASADLPLPRLLRLSLFQVSVGLAMALMVGTLNRVMIVELHMAAWLVALMVALPILAAPFRAFVGFRSDTHASATELDLGGQLDDLAQHGSQLVTVQRGVRRSHGTDGVGDSAHLIICCT